MSGCAHLVEASSADPEVTTRGCATCLELGWTWVHLRQCLSCGRVGCCDSSRGKHASAHYAEVGHPVMRSLEPGEDWRWCFIDETIG